MYKKRLIYTIAFLEGLNLMAFELISSRIIANSYGATVKIWAFILAITLCCLTLGYFLGGKLSARNNKGIKILLALVLITSVYLSSYPFFAPATADFFVHADNFFAMFFAFLLLVGFPIVTFGMITPVIIQLIAREQGTLSGKYAGFIYGVSTLGGVFGTFLFGLQLIPYQGVWFSSQLIALFLGVCLLLLFLLKKEFIGSIPDPG